MELGGWVGDGVEETKVKAIAQIQAEIEACHNNMKSSIASTFGEERSCLLEA
jgi:hypothetical protein